MEEVQRSVNWSAPDASAQVNRLAKQMALEALLAYMRGGDSALGTYRDKKRPVEVAETFKSLLSRADALPVYLPDLRRHLIEYPKFKLENTESQSYWEKVNFGLKPTLRIVHATVYRGIGPSAPAYAVALKQIYSSHYFQSALDLTVCVRDTDRPNQRGFYLITLKSSQQAGLTGVKGGIVRHVAVGKTRSPWNALLRPSNRGWKPHPTDVWPRPGNLGSLFKSTRGKASLTLETLIEQARVRSVFQVT